MSIPDIAEGGQGVNAKANRPSAQKKAGPAADALQFNASQSLTFRLGTRTTTTDYRHKTVVETSKGQVATSQFSLLCG
jgi:hypothetical protein